MTSTLTLLPLLRPGEKLSERTFKSQRRFLDLVVNRVSLWERLGKPHDMVSVLCADFVESETLNAVNGLLLKSESDLPNGRRLLFVCAECGDLGCGAITISVRRAAESVVWSDFGYENNYEAGVSLDDYKDVGPFEFEFHQYESALLDAVAQLRISTI
jgi:hypothetical protein